MVVSFICRMVLLVILAHGVPLSQSVCGKLSGIELPFLLYRQVVVHRCLMSERAQEFCFKKESLESRIYACPRPRTGIVDHKAYIWCSESEREFGPTIPLWRMDTSIPMTSTKGGAYLELPHVAAFLFHWKESISIAKRSTGFGSVFLKKIIARFFSRLVRPLQCYQ